jgi:hypothetical protein
MNDVLLIMIKQNRITYKVTTILHYEKDDTKIAAVVAKQGFDNVL